MMRCLSRSAKIQVGMSGIFEVSTLFPPRAGWFQRFWRLLIWSGEMWRRGGVVLDWLAKAPVGWGLSLRPIERDGEAELEPGADVRMFTAVAESLEGEESNDMVWTDSESIDVWTDSESKDMVLTDTSLGVLVSITEEDPIVGEWTRRCFGEQESE